MKINVLIFYAENIHLLNLLFRFFFVFIPQVFYFQKRYNVLGVYSDFIAKNLDFYVCAKNCSSAKVVNPDFSYILHYEGSATFFFFKLTY